MTELTAKLNPSEAKKAPQKPRAKSGRKSSKPRERKTPAGQGAILLRDSVNKKVGEQADAITDALIKVTKAGNATVAGLLVKLSGADKTPPDTKTKKRKTKTTRYIERLAAEPEYDPCNDPDAAKRNDDDDTPGDVWINDRWVRLQKPAY